MKFTASMKNKSDVEIPNLLLQYCLTHTKYQCWLEGNLAEYARPPSTALGELMVVGDSAALAGWSMHHLVGGGRVQIYPGFSSFWRHSSL